MSRSVSPNLTSTIDNASKPAFEADEQLNSTDSESIKRHPSYGQVMLDVKRCAGRLEHIREVHLHRIDEDDLPADLADELDKQRKSDLLYNNEDDGQETNGEDSSRSLSKLRDMKLKEKLAELIVKLLIRKPHLHYYQGFHDVCLTYMTLEGEKESFDKLCGLIDTHFGWFMQPTMSETQELLAYVPIIVGFEDTEVKSFLDRSEVGTIFALSWVITWFSHVIPYELDVQKIFRSLENCDPHLVLYLSAAIVLHKRENLLALQPDVSTVHHFLSQVPRKEKLPIDDLLEHATILFNRWPPQKVKRQVEWSAKTLQLKLYSYDLLQRYVPSSLTSVNAKAVMLVFVIASITSIWYTTH